MQLSCIISLIYVLFKIRVRNLYKYMRSEQIELFRQLCEKIIIVQSERSLLWTSLLIVHK